MISSLFFGHPRLNRNLGNQLFELASLVGLARRYNTSLYLSNKWQYSSYFKLSSFIQFKHIESFVTIEEPAFHCCLDFFDKFGTMIEKEDISIKGYLQSEKYWKFMELEIRELFSFNDSLLNSGRLFLRNNQIDIDKYAAISVRRGDFETDPYHYLLPIEYYRDAKEKYFPEKDLIIFSDDINWCKDNFQYKDKKVIFSENKNAIEQLSLMSFFKHFVIANSTFSWWGAYLSNEKQKTVIRPFHHFDGDLKEKADIKDHYPPEWIEYNYEQDKF